ncbi:hypothetical protein HDU84_007430, partial [Entophlyctis sp. JEL0112]
LVFETMRSSASDGDSIGDHDASVGGEFRLEVIEVGESSDGKLGLARAVTETDDAWAAALQLPEEEAEAEAEVEEAQEPRDAQCECECECEWESKCKCKCKRRKTA